MARKGLIYFLFNKDKKPLYVDDYGFVQAGTDDYFRHDGQPAHLAYSPDGWKDTLVKYARNIKYWGLLRDYTVPMKFSGDGAKILRKQVWEERGTETTTYLGIAKLDRTGLPYNYYNWYLSEINFSKFVQSKTGFQVEALEGGLSKLFKANENTVYEIPIDEDPEHINILMDGMEFDFKRVFNVIPDQELKPIPNYYLGLAEVAREGNTPEVEFQDIMPTQSAPYPNDYWVTRCQREQVFRLHGWLTAYYQNSDGLVMRVDVNNGVDTIEVNYPLLDMTGTPAAAGSTEKYEFDINFTVPAGYRAHIKIFTTSISGGTVNVVLKEGEFNMEYVYLHPESTIKALRPFRLLDRLIYKMTEGKYTAKSTRLENMLDYCVTSGDALRGITGSKIKTSLSDFFKSFFSRFNICLTVHNDQLVMEPMGDFFTTDIICDLGVIDDVTVNPAEDLMYNTIKAGYEKKDYTDANGRYETNQGQQWTMPVVKTIRELDMTSPYRADPFGIELMRINYDKKTTTDTSSDNDTFIINIDQTSQTFTVNAKFIAAGNIISVPNSLPVKVGQRIRVSGSSFNNNDYVISAVTNLIFGKLIVVDLPLSDEGFLPVTIEFLSQGVYNLYRPPYSSVTGIPHPDYAFNLELTPKKGLLANDSYLHSILDLLDTEKIKFQSADKNAELSTTLTGVTVTENEDIQIGGLAAPYFRPYYINFRTKVPINLVELLKANPWGRIQFSYQGNVFYGYLMDGGIKPATNDTQTWKLLSAPENDLSKL